MEKPVDVLWNAYASGKSPELRRDLAASYVNLVRYVVGKLGVPEQPRMVLRENDLVQVGMIGLMTAIERFDPGRGVRFETYAIPRIKGTILDELRRLDPVSRTQRRKEREERREGSGENEFRGLLVQESPVRVEPENLPADEAPGPDEQLVLEEQTRTLAGAIAALPERDRLVVTLHYYEGLSQRDIAAVLNLSESRVSQIHASVVGELRRAMGQAGFVNTEHRG